MERPDDVEGQTRLQELAKEGERHRGLRLRRVVARVTSGRTSSGLERREAVISDPDRRHYGQKYSLLKRYHAWTRSSRSARFSMPDIISRIDIRMFRRTMNGLSSCLEYGRGTDFADGLLCRWDPAWFSCDESPIWDMMYVNDG